MRGLDSFSFQGWGYPTIAQDNTLLRPQFQFSRQRRPVTEASAPVTSLSEAQKR